MGLDSVSVIRLFTLMLDFNFEFNRGPKKFSLCLNSKSMREKREGGKGQNTVVRKDPPS